jgi:hypothetical protein
MIANTTLSLASFFFASLVVIQCSAQTDSMTYRSCSAAAKSMTLEQAVESLTVSKDSSPFYSAISGTGLTGEPQGSNHFMITIGDPRVDRIRILLEEMEPAVASGLIKKKYLAEFDRFKTDWEQNDVRRGIMPSLRRHSVLSLLFLCSEFCPAKEFDALFLKWHIWHRKTEFGDNLAFGINAKVDELFVANVYANAMRKLGEDLASVSESVNRACDISKMRRFREMIDTSKNRLFEEQTEADFFVIQGWGNNVLTIGSVNPATLDFIQQLRGELIPEVKLYNTTIESIQKWLDDNDFALDPASK